MQPDVITESNEMRDIKTCNFSTIGPMLAAMANKKIEKWRSPFDPKPRKATTAKERNQRKNKKRMAKESRKNNRSK